MPYSSNVIFVIIYFDAVIKIHSVNDDSNITELQLYFKTSTT